MKRRKELRNYLLENHVDEYGNLDLSNLDFRDFDGNVYINNMRVQGDLVQSSQKVQGDLYNGNNQYGGEIYENQSKKMLKEITREELEKLGYTLK